MVQRLHIDVMCSMMLSFWQINIVRYRSSFLESTLLWGMAYYRKLFWSIALVLCLSLEYHTISSSFHSKCRYIYTRITSLKNNKNSYSVFLRNCKKRTIFFLKFVFITFIYNNYWYRNIQMLLTETKVL